MPRELRAEQILDATLHVIAGEGFAALSMERVAKEAGIAKSVIYAIFGSQAGLQRALMKREHDRAFAVSEAALAELEAAQDPIGGAAAALATYLDGVAVQPDTWRLVLLPVDGMPASIREAIASDREMWRRRLEPVIERLLDRLGLHGLDAELAAHVARGNAEYLARLIVEHPRRFPRERIASFALDVAARIASMSTTEEPA
jgi:AcrR family transcriptional regulator